MDLISVIIPVYKVESYLNRCIESVVNQTYKNLEIILVDDGSPDNCPQMCDEWAKKDSRISVIHKKNGGLSDARNAGMQLTTGELTAFVDSDDWIEPDFLAVLWNLMVETNADISACDYQKCYEDGTISDSGLKPAVYGRADAMSALIDGKIDHVVWNKLYKTVAIKSVLFEKGKYHEDAFWTYQIVGKAEVYSQTDYVGYNYLQRKGSIMGDIYSEKRLDAVEALCQWQIYLESNYPELVEKGREKLAFTCLYHGQLAIRTLKESSVVLEYLRNVFISNKPTENYMRNMKFSHRIWMFGASLSFVSACKLRNFLRIGC